MSRIVPKLNLNKTPQLVENNSLVFAKNIRLLKDGTIGPDTSLEEVETNTGDGTHHIVHHEAITEEVINFYYSILDYTNTLRYLNGLDLTDTPEFVFGNDIANYRFDDRYHYSDSNLYSHIPELETHIISCYKVINPANPSWYSNSFTYNKNTNKLVSATGLTFFIAIRREIYDHTSYQELDAPKFFYLVAPDMWQGTTIEDVFAEGADYIILNPVRKIKELETIIVQEEYDEEWDTYDTVQYIAHIVGLDNKIYFFKESNYIKDSVETRAAIVAEYPDAHFVDEQYVGDDPIEFDVNEEGYVTRNGVLFQDSSISTTLFPNFNDRVKIFEYDEELNTFTIVECAWKYNGGEINGCVSVNGTGEPILTICEYIGDNNLLVPIKHINLTKCTENDDESFYTQAPNIPISNLRLSGRYIKNIPAGVYQFFIRYKIREHFYTNWFPCSKELFAGSRKTIDTLQGSIKHTDLHEDSNNSFIFTIEHLYREYTANYEEFQLGFILSSDGGVFARSWKHFDMTLASTVSIYFDYNKTDIEEINIDDLLKVNYNVFNVGNVAQHKNKLYISNYTETDFNEPSLQVYADNIRVNFDLHKVDVTSGIYLNNIPLDEPINNIYETFGNIPISSIYNDSAYCTAIKAKEVTSQFNHAFGTYSHGAEVIITPGRSPKIRKLSVIDEDNASHTVYEFFEVMTDANMAHIYSADLGFDVINETSDTLIDATIDSIKSMILGIDNNGNFKINIDNTIKTITSFNIEFVSWGEVQMESYVDEHGEYLDRYYRTIYNKKFTVKVAIKGSMLTTSYVYNEYNTFLPFTKYDFYIHYVKENGITTNGYYICTKEINRYCRQYKEIQLADVPQEIITAVIQGLDTVDVLTNIDNIGDLSWYTPEMTEYAWYMDGSHNGRYFKLEEILTDNYIIVPNFNNIICPEGYVACFISYIKYGNNVAQGYNYDSEYNSSLGQTIHKLDCLELNTLLYNTSTNITVKDSKGNVVTDSANYYSSSTTNPLKYLGGSGHVEFATDGDNSYSSSLWLIIDSIGKPYNKQLTKLTPFIKLSHNDPTGYYEFIDINSPGYFCEVVTLDRDRCNNPNGYYVSGNDIYTRDLNNETLKLELEEDAVEYTYTTENYIFSNYNLNYVSLTSDLTPVIRRYAVENEGEDTETSEKQVITLVNSLLASYTLELKSFYKDYTKKLYQAFNKNNITRFDNTIRVSSVDVDELYRYIFRFEATDYYNVPTHRGIITNIIGIANSLYVHCEHSLFKFTDNKTLNAQEEEVTLQENDIFNSGISEVFDAQFGYGGLKNRKQSLVTFNAYVFYDAISKIIYAFGGEQQIGNISEPIQKIINTINPTDVQFVGDEINDRFFVNLRNNDGNVCLSFNFKSKSFISIHDIDFGEGFHSRRHTYFIHNNIFNDAVTGWSIYRIADKININHIDYYTAYQNCYTPSLINIEDLPVATGVNAAFSCIDVITNIEYEKIKVLNYINWICSEILNYGSNLNFVAEEELDRLYPGDKIRIYSDSTSTRLIDLVDENGNPKLAKEHRNVDAYSNSNAVKESWQYPTYNCGVFTMNYFRDVIRNGNVYTAPNPDLFKYKNAPNIGPNGLVDLTEYSQRQNLTQENSLIYGKYFVIRLIFNNRNFKIENVTFRMSDYGKTK